MILTNRELEKIAHEVEKLEGLTECVEEKLGTFLYEDLEPVHRAFEILLDQQKKVETLMHRQSVLNYPKALEELIDDFDKIAGACSRDEGKHLTTNVVKALQELRDWHEAELRPF